MVYVTYDKKTIWSICKFYLKMHLHKHIIIVQQPHFVQLEHLLLMAQSLTNLIGFQNYRGWCHVLFMRKCKQICVLQMCICPQQHREAVPNDTAKVCCCPNQLIFISHHITPDKWQGMYTEPVAHVIGLQQPPLLISSCYITDFYQHISKNSKSKSEHTCCPPALTI